MVRPKLQRVDRDRSILIRSSNKSTKSKGTLARPQNTDRDYCYSCWVRGSKSLHQSLSPICWRHATQVARGAEALEVYPLLDHAAEPEGILKPYPAARKSGWPASGDEG